MLFGALPSEPGWLVAELKVDPARVASMAAAIGEQRRREQLIFARWTLVMLHFEKSLYENPNQELNKLWWELVSRFQKIPAPQGRNAPDWAAKPHFTIAPVYYHNYMMGELFAAQLRHAITSLPPKDTKAVGEFFRTKVFAPGMRMRWPEFVKAATGEELTATFFAKELK